MRKRLGLNKGAIDKSFGDALLKGRKHNEFKGKFKKFLDSKAMIHGAAPIVYGQNIYWVTNDMKLITVYSVPSTYRKYL